MQTHCARSPELHLEHRNFPGEAMVQGQSSVQEALPALPQLSGAERQHIYTNTAAEASAFNLHRNLFEWSWVFKIFF